MGISLAGIGLSRFQPQRLDKSTSYKLERSRLRWQGQQSPAEVTVLAFDPARVRIYPLFSSGAESVKEHWQLNPGLCCSHTRNFEQYLADFSAVKPEARVVAVTNGNNLFSHPLDILVRTGEGEREFYTSDQNPDGPRSCLCLLPDGRAGVQDLDISNGRLAATDAVQAVYGQHILANGSVRPLLDDKFYRSFSGNYSHLFRFPRFDSPKPGYSFSVEKVEKCGSSLGIQQFVDEPGLAEASLNGQPVSLSIPPYGVMRKFTKPGQACPILTLPEFLAGLEQGVERPGAFKTMPVSAAMVLAALRNSGYTDHDFDLNMTAGNVTLLVRRSNLPHTVIGLTPDNAVLTAVFSGQHYKIGPVIEEAAEAMRQMGASDALLLGNGSEAAIYSGKLKRMVNTMAVTAGKKAMMEKSGNLAANAFSMTALVYYTEE